MMQWSKDLPTEQGLYVYYTGSPLHSYDVLVVEWCSLCKAFEIRSGANWKPLRHFGVGMWLRLIECPNMTKVV